MKSMRANGCALAAALLGLAPGGAGATAAHAQAQTPPAPATAKPCAAPEIQQFAFWVGEWDLGRDPRSRGGACPRTAPS